jgi:hypothetical protein
MRISLGSPLKFHDDPDILADQIGQACKPQSPGDKVGLLEP